MSIETSYSIRTGKFQKYLTQFSYYNLKNLTLTRLTCKHLNHGIKFTNTWYWMFFSTEIVRVSFVGSFARIIIKTGEYKTLSTFQAINKILEGTKYSIVRNFYDKNQWYLCENNFAILFNDNMEILLGIDEALNLVNADPSIGTLIEKTYLKKFEDYPKLPKVQYKDLNDEIQVKK